MVRERRKSLKFFLNLEKNQGQVRILIYNDKGTNYEKETNNHIIIMKKKLIIILLFFQFFV